MILKSSINHTFWPNYRPISPLNLYNKMLAKIPVTRLNILFGKLVHKDQVCFYAGSSARWQDLPESPLVLHSTQVACHHRISHPQPEKSLSRLSIVAISYTLHTEMGPEPILVHECWLCTIPRGRDFIILVLNLPLLISLEVEDKGVPSLSLMFHADHRTFG